MKEITCNAGMSGRSVCLCNVDKASTSFDWPQIRSSTCTKAKVHYLPNCFVLCNIAAEPKDTWYSLVCNQQQIGNHYYMTLQT